MNIVCAGQSFLWRFLRAAVAFPLLGTDFLIHHKLLVDLANMRLVGNSGTSIPLVSRRRAAFLRLRGFSLWSRCCHLRLKIAVLVVDRMCRCRHLRYKQALVHSRRR